MRWLLNRLGLTQIPNARLLIDTKVETYLRESAEKYAEKLAEKEPLSAANWNKVRKYLPDVSRNALPQTPQKREFLSEIRLRVLDREKTICRKIYEEGVISKTTFLHIMNSLDEMYDHDGQYALDFRPSIFKYCNRTSSLPYIKDALSLGESISLYFRERIVRVYDMARGFIILQNEDLSLLNELGRPTCSQRHKKSNWPRSGEIERNINRMNDVTKMLAQNYPKAFRHALTVKSIRMLLTYERRTIRKLQNDGVISEKDAERLIEKVDERTDEGNSFRYTVLGTLLRGIVHGAKKEGHGETNADGALTRPPYDSDQNLRRPDAPRNIRTHRPQSDVQPCGCRQRTLRRVREYSAASTIRDSARHHHDVRMPATCLLGFISCGNKKEGVSKSAPSFLCTKP